MELTRPRRVATAAAALVLAAAISALPLAAGPAHATGPAHAAGLAHRVDQSAGSFLTVSTEPADLNFRDIRPADRVEIVVSIGSSLPGPVHLRIAAHPLHGSEAHCHHRVSELDISRCSVPWDLQMSGRTPRAVCPGQLSTTMAPTPVIDGQALTADLGTVSPGTQTYRIAFTFDDDFGTTAAFESSTRFEISASELAPVEPQSGSPDILNLPYTGGLDPRWAGLIAIGVLLVGLARRGARHRTSGG